MYRFSLVVITLVLLASWARAQQRGAEQAPGKKPAVAEQPERSAAKPADLSTEESQRTKPEKSGRPSRTTSPVKAAELPAFTPEREAAALSFVEQNHSELLALLKQLNSKKNRKEYERAVRELFRASESLAATYERDPERYAFDLQLWKLESRIRLIAARYAMAREPQMQESLKSELRTALNEQLDVRIARSELERSRALKRIERMDAMLEKMRDQGPALVERTLQRLIEPSSRKTASDTTQAAKGETSKSNPRKPASKPESDKP